MRLFGLSVALLVTSAAGCDGDNVNSRAQSAENDVHVAHAIARQSADACAPALDVNLLSTDTGLRIDTARHVDEGCTDEHPAPASYAVGSVTYEAGRKTYEAASPLCALWIHDDRMADGATAAWQVVTRSFEGVPPADAEIVYTATSVIDENLRASGDSSIWLRVLLEQPLARVDVEKMIYSLLLDEARVAVQNSNDTAYDLLFVSDMPVATVINQVRANELVQSANLR